MKDGKKLKVESPSLKIERRRAPQQTGAMFNFEKLDVWHEAIAFADSIYALTAKFPPTEQYGLTSQMRRAAVSVSSNIAEGSSRSSRTDFARFVEIASGSLFEVVSQATIALHQSFITDAEKKCVYEAALKQVKMLSGLHRSLVP